MAFAYYWWVKPIKGRPNICSQFCKKTESDSRLCRTTLIEYGWVCLKTDDEAQWWQYAEIEDGTEKLRSLIEADKSEPIQGAERYD